VQFTICRHMARPQGCLLSRGGIFFGGGEDTGRAVTVAGCSAPVEQVKSAFAPQVREKITVLPFVTREEIPAMYGQHDVFVFSIAGGRDAAYFAGSDGYGDAGCDDQ